MAVLVGVPCLGISYDPKIESFLKIVDMPCAGRIGALTLPVLLELIERLTTEPPGGAQSMQDKVCILGDRARDNARFALQLIQLSRRKH
jgi:polysaccharide pyruvyl transferase WcaK-like protein